MIMQVRLAADEPLVDQCWDLPALAQEYHQFNAFYEHDIAQFEEMGSTATPPSAADCFVRRFMLPVRLFPILQKDPNLPLDMLPKAWPGTIGRNLFTHYRNLLTPQVDPFIDKVVAGER